MLRLPRQETAPPEVSSAAAKPIIAASAAKDDPYLPSAPKQADSTTVSPPSVNPREARSVRSLFIGKLAAAQVLDEREGLFGELKAPYKDQLIKGFDPRYPLLVRRMFEAGPALKNHDPRHFTEIQVATQFMLQLEEGQSLKKEGLTAELQSKIKSIKHMNDSTYQVSFEVKNLDERESLREELARVSDVRGVYNDKFVFAAAIPNDPLYKTFQWPFKNTGRNPYFPTLPGFAFTANWDAKVESAWEIATDCKKIHVAVIDTGIDPDHPDFKDSILTKDGRNFLPGADLANFRDDNYHGTHVAGIFGAKGNDGIGVSGVCWSAQIIPIKVLDASGSGPTSTVIAGVSYAAETSAKILNLSLTGGGLPLVTNEDPNDPYYVALKKSEKAGQLAVIASGNNTLDLTELESYPGTYDIDSIINVGATDPRAALAAFSNFGSSVHIAAQGDEITSAFPLTATIETFMQIRDAQGAVINGYAVMGGTSQAAPLVAGAVALFWSYAPELSPAQVKKFLLEYSTRPTVNLKVADNRTLDLDKLMQATQTEFEVAGLGEDTDLLAGDPYTLDLKVLKSSIFLVAKTEVFHEQNLLAQFDGLEKKIIFNLPEGPDPQLSVRLTDSGGRVFNTDPFSVRVGTTEGRKLDFTKLVDLPPGDVKCRLSLLRKDNLRAIREIDVDSIRLCEKFCDITTPLMRSKSHRVSCGQAN